MQEPLVYGIALALFGFTVFATARIPLGFMLVGCIPAVFVALVMGFTMGVYAADLYGWGLLVVALVPAAAGAWYVSRRFRPRDLLIAIYLAWAVGLVFALIGVQMPDVG